MLSFTLTGITPSILDKMDEYMDNMANAVTNKKFFLERLVTNNSKQSSAVSTQASTVLSLSD